VPYRGIHCAISGCVALTVLAVLPPTVGAAGDITVAPRWGAMWLSPRLTANWVNLKYAGAPSEQPPVGEVIIELPAGIRCLWSYEVTVRETPTQDGRTRITLGSVPLDGSKGMYLVLATDLKPGTDGVGRSWAQWEGGQPSISEFPINVIDVPVARQPKQIMTGMAIWPYMIDNWPDFYRQYASMGFNQMNLWHGAIYVADQYAAGPDRSPALDYVSGVAKAARENGIMTSIDASVSWDDDLLKNDPDAQALFVDGTRAGPCPSYRGPAFIDYIRKNAAIAMSGISYIQSDEETYGTGNFVTACVCPRCEARWREWLKANRPGLEYVSPREVITRKDELPDHYRAWLWFRASLTTERYAIYKQELERAVAQAGGPGSSPKPLIGWWAAAAEDYTLERCMQDGRALADVIDQVIPQLYFRYGIPPRRFRDLIRRQCWALGREKCYAGIDSDHPDAGVPGNLTAAVLETLFAGGQGYCVWYGPYMDTRQRAELAAVNDVVARYERTFVEGTDTDLFRCFAPEGEGDYFHPWSDDVFASTLETEAEGLLLISDYRQERTPLLVERSRRYAGPMTLRDAFSGEKVADLTAGQWEFRTHLKDSPVRLLVWEKREGDQETTPSPVRSTQQ
jgi:hypothetical protein